MVYTSVDETTKLYLMPLEQDIDTIKSCINQASDFDHKTLKTMTFIYLMDIRHINPQYGSLIFDYHGNILRSEWSTSRISNEIFCAYGYNYDSWSRFLKKTYERPRTIFPFVKDNHVYLRLTDSKRKHSSWINLTLLSGIKIATINKNPRSYVELDSMNLIFKPEVNDESYFHALELYFNQKISKLVSQISYAYQLTNIWYDFNSHIDKEQLFRERNPMSKYLNNPAFELFINQRIPYRKRLGNQLKLDQFIKYNKIREHLTHTDRRSSDIINSKLLLRRLHKELFAEAFKN